MVRPAPRSLVSHFHTPAGDSARLFHTVLRAGHMQASADYCVERRASPGHDLLFCVEGAGSVRCADKMFVVAPGQLAWIDGRQPHAHWADPRRPWELLWLRIDGRPSRLFAEALNAREAPLFNLASDIRDDFAAIFALLRARPLGIDAALHAAVTSIAARLFESRQLACGNEAVIPEGPADGSLHEVLRHMRREYWRHWKIEELARLGQMSAPHFFRRFRKATGSSPVDWLRRERINQAKRRLSEGEDRIRAIAAELGYSDPFYFSRDFKKLTGLSPRRYRQQERMLTQGQRNAS
ncbi:MAG TPA: AraC family transcriptional regulator [Rhizomicrobium sp.]|nr:AraC family transcriptional regulator [Rhizomicrobium sp.]